MKHLHLLLALCLSSVGAWAGNDLLWDYTEKAPSSNPDNGLYYESKVDDGVKHTSGTNNLNGIKLNSSGYAYFRKEAVAGKLRLGYGDRKTAKDACVNVYTWPGTLADKPATTAGMTLIGSTQKIKEYGIKTIDLTAEQQNIYITRGTDVESVLQYINFKEDVVRSFVDFKIEFRDNPYSVPQPESGVLPEGVSVNCPTYNGPQHGVQGGTITVPVDGTVKFTIGACQHSQTDITVKKDGEYYATISNKALCGEQKPNYNQFVPYYYLGEAGILTFEFGSQTYVPYFFAEAADITPCQVIFKDQNGNELNRIDTYEGATLGILPEVSVLPEFCDQCFFRGWFYTSNKKAKIGDIISGNTTIQAKVTPLETATVGSVQTYNFADQTFYPEDHETVEVHGGEFHDATHGWYFTGNESMFDNLGDIKGIINVSVAGKAIVVITACTYSENGTIEMASNEEWPGVSFTVEKDVTTDGKEFVVEWPYDRATRLTILLHNKQYIHKVVVYNVQDFPQKDEKTGYYIVPANDVAAFLMTLAQANAEGNAKIFLPNGYYDMGETVLTEINANNISIIGQSMEKTIIRNAPSYLIEQINTTATLKITKDVQNTYFQDLTLQNDLDYYHNDDGRAVCLWDQGKKTICKNVRMISHQDTYYSNLIGGTKYFENCEIHGTVDYICGDGNVYFKNTDLICEQRYKGGNGGADYITASNADKSDKGYVFESCRVRYAEGIQGTKPVISFGRSWNNAPKTVFLNTVLDDSNGTIVMTKESEKPKERVARWTIGAMNALPECFGEYNSVDNNGNVVSPASNIVTFILGEETKEMNTILSAEQAAKYTMEYTLGNWAATAANDAKQVLALPVADDAIYLVEFPDGNCAIMTGEELNRKDLLPETTFRRANARGGFGPKNGESTAIESVLTITEGVCNKQIIDGRIVIFRNGQSYTITGQNL
ncbi:MAG: hypothetical protein IJP52_02380 [Paludibacteraceae bacterium]|nr:hypothetical protein [Paludibacteraceae bacterium]